MPQYFVAPEDVQKDRFRLAGEEAHHLVKVMRCAKGDALTLFDGKGGRYEGIIEEVAADGSVLGKVVSSAQGMTTGPHLYLGLLKSAHWDDALDKAVQLGAASVTPLLTPRTVVLLHEVERAKTKQERWARLVTAAAKQSGRADLMPVKDPVQFRDAIRAVKDKGVILLAYEGLKGETAAGAVGKALRAAPKADVHVFVGPEGGFTQDEVDLARAEGAVVFGLGPRVLRAEAAAATAVALVQYERGGI